MGQVLRNDKIVVAGQRDDNLMVARAMSNGDLDTFVCRAEWLSGSEVREPSSARSVVVDSQDRILVLGHRAWMASATSSWPATFRMDSLT